MYDPNGNITEKSGAGTYSYDNSRVNALTGITNYDSTFCTTDQNNVYNAFNMTDSVSEGDKNIKFTYGSDNQRVKSVLKNNGTVVRTKYYSPGYERDSTSSGVLQLTYIFSPFGLVAINIKDNTTDSTFYVETDHLGSIIGLKTDTTYRQRYSYDAWGRRRNPNTWAYDTIPVPTFIDRGYTGHEHLTEFGLINMNGRMYDPVVARFLGVDTIIQFGDNSQSYNGYSYCLNNPLKYTDPSGFVYHYDPWTQQDGKYHPLKEQMDERFGLMIGDFEMSQSDQRSFCSQFEQDQLENENELQPQVEEKWVIDKSGKFVKVLVPVKRIIPDKISISIELKVAVIKGIGQNIEFNWITHGKDASIFPYVTNTLSNRNGIEGDAGISFNVAWFLGNPNEIKKEFLYGPSLDIDGGYLPYGGTIFVGYDDKGRPLWIGGGTGIGGTLGGSWGNGITKPGL